MTLQVVPLTREHVAAAATLVARSYRRLRRSIPALPPRYGDEAALAPMLEGIVGAGPGVAAMERGGLVGFMAAFVIVSFKGRRAAHCPEWAHAAEGDAATRGARAIHERMYAAAASAWGRAGCSCHLIGQFPDDRDALDAWFHQGFGLICIDAVRDLTLPAAPLPPVEVRRAGAADVPALAALGRGLADHLRSAPAFVDHHPEDEDAWAGRLQDDAMAVWMALDAGRPAAYMRIGPASDDACGIIVDEGMASITGAYAEPGVRRQGLATALLCACVAWAAERGYARCAVDFESANIEASRFWRRHFAPVCYSLMRVVDEASLGDRMG